MKNDKNKKYLKKSLKFRLEGILEISKEVNSTMSVVYSYCKNRNDSETVDNILHMLKSVVEKTDEISFNICQILDDNTEIVSDFISKITPLNYDEVIVDD